MGDHRSRPVQRANPDRGGHLRRPAPRAASEALGERGITTWDGNFYAQALIERLGLQESGGVLRIGLAHYNTADEVDRLIAALQEIVAG